LIPQIEDLGRDGFPYLEGARSRTELQLRECIRKLFGEKSPEYLTYKQHKLSMETPAQTKQSTTLIRQLIVSLEDKKLEAQGLKPSPPEPAPTPMARPQMTLVPPSTPTAQVTITPATPVMPPPITMSVALTTNLDMPRAAAPIQQVVAQPVPPSHVEPPRPQPVAASIPTPPIAPVTPAAARPVATPLAPTPPATPAPQASVPATTPAPPIATQVSAPQLSPAPVPAPQHTPVASTAPPQSAIVSAPTQQKKVEAPPAPAKESTLTTPASDVKKVSVESATDSAEIVKSLCKRFHLVARQLRLRGEYRATLNVEDEFDVQDLLHALLRLHFDDIETDEWVPSYSNGAPRLTFLLNDGRLALIVKKTRTGLNVKDLAGQFQIDVDRCRTFKRCSTLLCFVYDPEGRIGNPRGLEADLISISDQLTADVFVAPK
jgi:hypothetical protein